MLDTEEYGRKEYKIKWGLYTTLSPNVKAPFYTSITIFFKIKS